VERIARPLVPLLLLVASAMALLSIRPNVRAYEPAAVRRYLHAAYPFAAEAALVLANSTMKEVTIRGRVYSPAGRSAPLADVVLPAHEQTMVDLGLQIARPGREFSSGGLELEFESADPGIAGQLALKEVANRQDRAIFPTYYVYRNGQLVGGFYQSAMSTFVALDGFYQRQPGEIQ
jgi:hypothetical protein